MYTLSNRGALAAVDANPVADAQVLLPRLSQTILAQLQVVSTGTPATYALRAAIEASMDGGSTWFQMCRFADVTADGTQIMRAASATTVQDATVTASSLNSASASPVITDTPWPRILRAVTKLQTLTGGASPTVAATIVFELGD
jgi:hypothetical protein